MLPAVGLAMLAAGCSSGSPVSQRSLSVGVESAPPPPRGALVLGGESGRRAVALAVGKGKLTATVLAPEGGPLSGLKVAFRTGSRRDSGEPCGLGCYSAAVAAAAARRGAAEREHAGRLRHPRAGAPRRRDRGPRGPGHTVAEEPRLRGVASLRPDRRPADDLEPAGAERGRVPDPRRRRRDRARHAPLGPRPAGRAVAPLAAAPGAARAAAGLGLAGDQRLRPRHGARRRPPGLGRLLRQPDHACLVHGLDRPRHVPPAAPAHDGGGPLHDAPLSRVRPPLKIEPPR